MKLLPLIVKRENKIEKNIFTKIEKLQIENNKLSFIYFRNNEPFLFEILTSDILELKIY